MKTVEPRPHLGPHRLGSAVSGSRRWDGDSDVGETWAQPRVPWTGERVSCAL